MTATEFERIHDSFRPRVLRYLTRLVGERDAEDLAQTVMLKVSSGLAGFRRDSSLATWIYRIATNVAMDRLRVPMREQAQEAELGLEEGEVPPDSRAPSVETIAIRTEMSACIRDFVDHLPGPYKMVMVLSEIEGFKNAEIAANYRLRADSPRNRTRDRAAQPGRPSTRSTNAPARPTWFTSGGNKPRKDSVLRDDGSIVAGSPALGCRIVSAVRVASSPGR